MLDKKNLSETDVRTKYITPAIIKAGWSNEQFLEEVSITNGKIIVSGKLHKRLVNLKADYVLYYKSNIPIAVIEAKKSYKTTPATGMQQALNYGKYLEVPFIFSTNGEGFLFHDNTAQSEDVEKYLKMDEFPSPEELWIKYLKYKNLESPDTRKIVSQEYHIEVGGRVPRYYQQIAINRTLEAIAKGQNRILLVMATGTGKTYTAFQIIHRLWKVGAKKRILFLADRTALIDQTMRGDFKHFKDKMTFIRHREIDTSYEIYMALYQGLSGADDSANAYKEFSPNFFDLIVIDECHRGSAKEDSAWREILNYFKSATHIGLTATPKETNEVSNIEYFGEPLYTYSLKQGIDDGFLAPYSVLRVNINIDVLGWRPEKGKKDIDGDEVPDREYNRTDYDRNLVIEERTQLVAEKITEFLKGFDRFAKTIVFCADIDHAERMRIALTNCNPDLVKEDYRYVMRITGDNQEGKMELDNFINPEEKYPVIATTSELMTTGVDAQTCKLIVLDAEIKSMTKFKQIIGRGTRINEEYGKYYFTILDFRNATKLFADKDFDGDPIRVKEVSQNEDISDFAQETSSFEESQTIDDTSGNELEAPIEISYPTPEVIDCPAAEPKPKIYVNGIDVSILAERELRFDRNGKLITKSLKDYTKELITGEFASLDDFIRKWSDTDKKEILIAELEEQGIPIDALRDSVKEQVDLFDLICHVAFDQPPLTRKERANNVKKRNVFAKYSEKARKVLEALLDKYADDGIVNIENMDVLKLKPISEFGSVIEIVNDIFGSKSDYLSAIKVLESELYKTGA